MQLSDDMRKAVDDISRAVEENNPVEDLARIRERAVEDVRENHSEILRERLDSAVFENFVKERTDSGRTVMGEIAVPGEENARIEKLFRAEERLHREEDFLEMEKYLEQRNRE